MNKVCSLAIRFTAEDRNIIEKVSLDEGKGASTWIREIVSSHLIKMGKKKKSQGIIRDYRR